MFPIGEPSANTPRAREVRAYLDRLPHVLRRLILRQALYRGIDWAKGSTDGNFNDQRQRTDRLDLAEVVSSENASTDGRFHVPIIDIDVPAFLVNSSTPGHSHLYLDVPMTWDKLERLLEALVEVGVVEEGYLKASRARRCTYARLPWVRKGHEDEAFGFESLEEVEAFLAAESSTVEDLWKSPPDPWAERTGDLPF